MTEYKTKVVYLNSEKRPLCVLPVKEFLCCKLFLTSKMNIPVPRKIRSLLGVINKLCIFAFLSDLLKAKEKANKYLTAVVNCSGAL